MCTAMLDCDYALVILFLLKTRDGGSSFSIFVVINDIDAQSVFIFSIEKNNETVMT